MSQSQGIEVRPTRRTVARGAAWAVPVIAVTAAAPAMASSPGCIPEFTTTEGSFKCCNTSVKNMKLVILVTDVAGCLVEGESSVCITDIQLGNGQDRGQLVFEGGQCTTESGTITAYLLDTDSCTVNLEIYYSIDGGPVQVTELQSDNIPSGNTAGDCQP